jgi:hypothetical protein
MRPRVTMVATLALAGLLLTPAVGAQASPTTAVSMFSDKGEYVGAGENRLYVAPSDQITVTRDGAGLIVHAGPIATGFNFDFRPPIGQSLSAGVYDRAQRAASSTRPTIDIYGNGRGCNETLGRFEVRDIAIGASGSVERLWVIYEDHCEKGGPALFGEIRFNEQFVQPFAAATPFVVRWPPIDLGAHGSTVPVTVFADTARTMARVSVTGADADSFPVKDDGCTGKALAVGGSCQVLVGFAPTSAGSRTATLHVEDTNGRDNAAILQAFSYGGTTKLVMHSDSGDFVGNGKDWSYTPANASLGAGGSPQHLAFGVLGADGRAWHVDLVPPSGQTLTPGSYPDAHHYPVQGSGPGLSVYGDGRACNTLTGSFAVTEATFDADGPVRFGATFEQHCDGATPALSGELDFRAGDTATPAAWMTTSAGATPLSFTPAHSQPTTGPCSGARFSGAWVVVGTPDNDNLVGTSGMDIISGLGGGDAIGGTDGDDCLDGGPGGDRLFGGPGNDLLAGGKGDDTLFGGTGQDKFKCSDGDDTVYAEPGESVDADCEHVNG